MPRALIICFTLSIFLMSVRIFAQSGQNDVITDPSITTRCRVMLERRERLREIKQKLIALKKRNDNLMSKTPEEKKSIKEKAERSGRQLAREIDLNQLKLQNMEETIIKNGCPGISR